MMHLLNDNVALIDHIMGTLYERSRHQDLYSQDTFNVVTASGVLFLLGQRQNQHSGEGEPCLILNKRSIKVKQPGDLCCPGGRVAPRLDGLLAKLVRSCRPLLLDVGPIGHRGKPSGYSMRGCWRFCGRPV